MESKQEMLELEKKEKLSDSDDPHPFLPEKNGGKSEHFLAEEEDKKDTYVVDREVWGNQMEFLLTCIGYNVGLGNIWRFPYLCLQNGGGAFLVAYFTCLIVCGMPLFFAEVALGQYASASPIKVWDICPLVRGIGWGFAIVAGIVSLYFFIIMSWVFFYLGISLQSLGTMELPWGKCDNEWNTMFCVEGKRDFLNNHTTFNNTNATLSLSEAAPNLPANFTWNVTDPPQWRSPAEEFWLHRCLELSPGIEYLGGLRWDLGLCFLASMAITYMCLCKGIKSSGKAVYVTATAPYILLTILVIRSAMLPGSLDGVKFYLYPEWSKLLDFNMWALAGQQIFYTLGPGWGGLITFASYNKFNHNCLRDSIILPWTCCLTSFFAGFLIFSVVGFMSREYGLSMHDAIKAGPGLAFIAYPEALTRMPLSPIWAILFFTMILTVGLDSIFGMIESIVSGIADQFPNVIGRRKFVFTILVFVLFGLMSFPFITRAGLYYFQLIDWYCAFICIFIFCLIELVVISWVYGSARFSENIQEMTGSRPSLAWTICWRFVTPLILFVLMIYNLAYYSPPKLGDYIYPEWSIWVGWFVAFVSLIPFPIHLAYDILQQDGTLLERLKILIQPLPTWGPAKTSAV